MWIVSIAGIAVCAGIVSLALREWRREYAVLAVTAAGFLILLYTIPQAKDVLDTLARHLSDAGLTETFAPLLKVLGVSFLTQFAADLCRDCGESSLAVKMEFAGKCAALVLALPLFTELLGLIAGLLR